MEKETIPRLRVLVTDGPGVRLDEVTRTVAGLGHEVVARESSLLEVAHILARACGHGGSCAAYLFHTVRHLDELGIRDRNLWRLQQMVADEIRQLHAVSRGAP